MVMVGVGYRSKPNLLINFYPNKSISGQLDSYISLNSQFIYSTKILQTKSIKRNKNLKFANIC